MICAGVCSGISAPAVAWGPLGWQWAFESEIEAFPSAVMHHHRPDVPNLGDMTQYRSWPDATIDLLVGGTPCQSFSVAGLRKGLDDPRGNLALVFIGLVDRYRPRWVVWENVPGVLSSNEGRDFQAFIDGMAEIGYFGAWRVLDAQWFGVAQRRRRVFAVFCPGDWRPAAAVLFEPESLRGDSAPGREAGEGPTHSVIKGAAIGRKPEAGPQFGEVLEDGTCYTLNCTEQHAVAGTLGGSSQSGGFRTTDLDNSGAFIPEIAPTLNDCSNGGGANGPGRSVDSVKSLIAMAHGQTNAAVIQDGTGRGTAMVPVAFSCKDNGRDAQQDISPTLRSMSHDGSHANGGGQMAVSQPRFARNGRGAPSDLAPALTSEPGQTGKGDSLPCVFGFNGDQSEKTRSMGEAIEQAPTLRADGPAHVNASAVRRLTPTECERLQGFPDGYTDIPWRGKKHAPDGPRYKALGNSMAVPAVRWIGERIALFEDSNP